jgi:outer membrane murein-binding lipoprotein Lpp
MSRSLIFALALAALTLGGCAKAVDDDLFVAVSIDQLRIMFDEGLTSGQALERAVEKNDTSVEDIQAYQTQLEGDPDHLRAVQDRINRETEELFTPTLLD